MKKTIKIVLIALFSAVILLIGIDKIGKYYTLKNNFLEPKAETFSSINQSYKEHDLKGELLFAEDEKANQKLRESFSPGQIFVLSRDLKLIDCNFINSGGRCFADISKDLCNGSELDIRFDDKFTKELLSRLSAYTNFDKKKIDLVDKLVENDKVIIYTWAKYNLLSLDREGNMNFLDCIEKENTVFSINCDSLLY